MSHITPSKRDAIREFLSCICDEYGDRMHSPSLFGSNVPGDADAESDMDLLPLVDDEDAAFRSQLWPIAPDVSLEDNLVLSVGVFAQARARQLAAGYWA